MFANVGVFESSIFTDVKSVIPYYFVMQYLSTLELKVFVVEYSMTPE